MATPPRRAPRARDADDPGDDEGFSYAPRRKTVKMNPILAIALFATPLVLIIAIGILYYQKTQSAPPPAPVEKVDGNEAYDAIKRKIPAARKLYMKAAELRKGEDQEEFQVALQAAKDLIIDLLDQYDFQILDDIRKKHNDLVPPEYGEYMVDYQKLKTWMNDLVRMSNF